MLKVTNKLKLQDDASEESIVAGISEIQNKLDASVITNKAKDDELARMKNDLDVMTDTYNKLKTESDADKAAALTDKVTNMVKGFVTIGKIKNESAAKYIAAGIKDFDLVKNMLDELPLNKDAVRLETSETKIETVVSSTYNIASAMAEITNKQKK